MDRLLLVTHDPLRAFVAGAFVGGTRQPLPLAWMRFDVLIEAGFAIVTTTRCFRNAETSSIEATITFPVPIHATLFALTARIGERRLEGRARCRETARCDYENAIDRGKTAVLHEEVLRGVHMLSVGHIPSGAEIEICTRWAVTLTNAGKVSTLRIPLTVGHIYGRSPLSDSDDLIHGGPLQMGALAVVCRDGEAQLRGAGPVEGQVDVPLNAPIDLQIRGWTPKDLYGRTADGRRAVLRIDRAPSADAPLHVVFLVDRSSSMNEVCAVEDRAITKHEAVIAGLHAASDEVRDGDAVHLWEFGDLRRSCWRSGKQGKRHRGQ